MPITGVQVGDLVSYTAIVSNVGTGVATGVVISASLASNVEFVAGNSTPGWVCVDQTCTYSPAANTSQSALVAAAPLPAGATITTMLVVRIGHWSAGSQAAAPVWMTVRDNSGATPEPANNGQMPALIWLDVHPYWLPMLIKPGE